MSVTTTGAAPVERVRTRTVLVPFARPLATKTHVQPPNVAGNGLAWDEDAVARHLVTR